MENGKDLRNKCIIFDNILYTIGGNYYLGEKLAIESQIWSQIESYQELVLDNLDCWSCGLAFSLCEKEEIGQEFDDGNELLE